MSKSKNAPTLKPVEAVDWTGVRLQRVEYEPAAKIFAQGDPATSVMYVEKGAVRLSVLSHAGKEAVVALLDVGHFFGEGCLAGQSQRMASATAMAPCTILAVEKQEMVRHLHAEPAFADRFLTHMLTGTSESKKISSTSFSTPPKSGLPVRSCCWRGTANPRRLTAPFRSCLKKSWPKWSARHGRG